MSLSSLNKTFMAPHKNRLKTTLSRTVKRKKTRQNKTQMTTNNNQTTRSAMELKATKSRWTSTRRKLPKMKRTTQTARKRQRMRRSKLRKTRTTTNNKKRKINNKKRRTMIRRLMTMRSSKTKLKPMGTSKHKMRRLLSRANKAVLRTKKKKYPQIKIIQMKIINPRKKMQKKTKENKIKTWKKKRKNILNKHPQDRLQRNLPQSLRLLLLSSQAVNLLPSLRLNLKLRNHNLNQKHLQKNQQRKLQPQTEREEATT